MAEKKSELHFCTRVSEEMKGADRRAGLAVVEIGRSTGRADILNAIREAGREKDVSTDCESETLYKLQERHVKRGGPDKCALQTSKEIIPHIHVIAHKKWMIGEDLKMMDEIRRKSKIKKNIIDYTKK